MSQPAHVRVSSGIPVEHHDSILHMIELVAEIARAPLEHTEIHIKMGSRKYGQVTGYAYYNYDGRPFRDQAVPSRIRCGPGVCELVTIKLQPGYWEYYSRWPSRDLHYARYKTFPHTHVYNWQEEFVYVLRHEFQHVVQYHRPRLASGRASSSELECETEAIVGLGLYRLVLGLADAPAGAVVGRAARR